jgi:hypothetical protein
MQAVGAAAAAAAAAAAGASASSASSSAGAPAPLPDVEDSELDRLCRKLGLDKVRPPPCGAVV